MNFILAMAAAICFSLLSIFTLLFRKLVPEDRSSFMAGDWREAAAEDRYRPMERLLSRQELEFLAAHPGAGRDLERRFRARRRRVFRAYLACLRRDHACLSQAIKTLMLDSARDRADLAAFLLRQRLWFTLGLMAVELRLILYALGVGQVDVRALVGALDTLRLELHSLAQAAQPAAA